MGKGRRALPCPVQVLLVLLTAVASLHGEPQYMVLVPSQLHTETPEQSCLHLYHLNETVTVRASLQHSRGNRNLFRDIMADRDLFHCVSFTIPRFSPADLVVVLSVHIEGATHEFRKSKAVWVKNTESVIFVQTDKPMYKPGQSVKFRVVSMDKKFLPLDELFPLLYIEDPKNNRIMQWQNINTEHGLKQLSFSLSSEPILGSYKIVALRQSGVKMEHSFTVEKFVLPKFEVQVKLPKVITTLDKEMNVTVCGRYTYGKPVAGHVEIRVCRRHPRRRHLPYHIALQSVEACEEDRYQLDSNGCITQQQKLSALGPNQTDYEVDSFHVKAKITEEGTGMEFTGSGTTKITRTMTKVEFVKVDPYFRTGIPFLVKVRLVNGKGVPITNEQVSIRTNNRHYQGSAITDQHGLAEFSLNTKDLTDNTFNIHVYHKEQSPCSYGHCMGEKHEAAFHKAHRVFSFSNSYIYLETEAGVLPCGQNHTFQVHYTLNRTVLGERRELVFYYLIMAKGKIIQTGTHTVWEEPGKSNGHFGLEIPVDVGMAPIAQMLIYTILPDGEVIGDAAKFDIEKCLPNKVDLSFSPAQSLPASQAHLHVTASPQSLCALRAVDQSVLLLKPETELSPSWALDWAVLPLKIFRTELVRVMRSVGAKLNFPDKWKWHTSTRNIAKADEDVNRTYGLGADTSGSDPKEQFYIFVSLPGMKYIPSRNEQNEDEEYCLRNKRELYYEMYRLLFRKDGKDIYRYMKDMGLKAFTNLKLHHPLLCPDYGVYSDIEHMYKNMHYYPVPIHRTTHKETQTEVHETVRKYFPETWIWDVVMVNSSGVAELGVTVPDTITDWKAGALCLSKDTGLGLSPTASLRAFQPFFVELTMPYSVVRGEFFTLKATVMNYLPTCIRVDVQLEASPDFVAVPGGNVQDSYCVCASGRHTASWTVTPKSLGNLNFSVTAEARQSSELCGAEVATVPETGKKDTVVRALLVEPEGIQKEHTFNSLLCASDTDLSEKLSLKLPSTVVKDSARAYFSVLGDILGSAITNLENLLHMPYGCGEQNMVLFAPNIYVLKYLNEIQQLTEKIKSKAIGYLNAGYQRELNYKHNDGSYSAFGDKDGKTQGNTWLTAFVLKSFAQAKTFIFIDNQHITQAFHWLTKEQKDNGCFRSSGSLFNSALKGGVEDEGSLSAYITIALLEIPLPATHPVVSNALTCLESVWKSAQQGPRGRHVYTKALLAYAFALSGNQKRRNEVLKSLDKEALKEGTSVHWERTQKPSAPARQLYAPQAPSAEVEMTAYVLLAHLTTQPAPSPEDLTAAVPIVKWLTRQQNFRGGFSSTQDTVVALHALSRYQGATFSRSHKSSSVTIQSSGTFSRNFQVENSNRLLLQQVPLPDIPGEYDIIVSGEGCAYTQATLKYNVHWEKQESAFTLQVQTVPQTCDGPKAHTSFQISLEVSYIGNRLISNMAIIDVKMVSGFIPLKPTVKMLESSSHVSRTDVSNSNVLIYLDQVDNKILNFSFTVQQDIPVRNLQPAVVKVYDYYETDEAALAEYSAPCSTDSEQNF